MTRTAILVYVGLVFAAMAMAPLGGFGIKVTLPDASDPRQKDAALLVQPMGCHGPGASVLARAEGIVNGKRKTIELTSFVLDKGDEQSRGPLVMLKRQWPSNGTWVVAITAQREGMHAHAIAKIAANGNILTIARPSERSYNEAMTLPDGKTKLLLYPFSGESKVAATYIVWGDLQAAVEHTLRGL